MLVKFRKWRSPQPTTYDLDNQSARRIVSYKPRQKLQSSYRCISASGMFKTASDTRLESRFWMSTLQLYIFYCSVVPGDTKNLYFALRMCFLTYGSQSRDYFPKPDARVFNEEPEPWQVRNLYILFGLKKKQATKRWLLLAAAATDELAETE
jgi:hypothetical protein